MNVKFLIASLLLIGATAVASVEPVPVHTSCGKTVSLESDDYENAAEMIADAVAVDEAVCP